MATPLVATHRVNIAYAVPGARPHQLRMLCSAVPDALDLSGYSVLGRAPGNIGFHLAMAYLMPLLKLVLTHDTSITDPVLEKYVSGAYVPVTTDASGGAGTPVTTAQVTNQTSISLRSTVGTERLRIQLMEPASTQSANLGRYEAVSTIPFADMKNWAGAFTDTASAVSAWQWVQNRGANYISSFIALVFDTNDRLRRDRGLG